MKKAFLLLVLISCLFSLKAQQRYGFIDTEYILNAIPEFKSAQEQLDKVSQHWQVEIEQLYVQIEEMHTKFRADQVFLSPEMREKREKEIAEKEGQAQKLQQKYFGRNGELYKKRQELVKPIQDEIYDAVKDIAKAGNYGMIVDRANGPVIIYYNAKFDLSNKVLSKMGYKN